MALTPTPVAFDVALAHADRGLEVSLRLRTARHPSETGERLWLRILAYLWQYDERLRFSGQLCEGGDEPDLLAQDDTGLTTVWVQVGKPDPKRIQRAVDRNPHAHVAVLFASPDRLRRFLREIDDSGLERVGEAELAAADPDLLKWLAAPDSKRGTLRVTWVADHVYVERDGEQRDGPLWRAGDVAQA